MALKRHFYRRIFPAENSQHRTTPSIVILNNTSDVTRWHSIMASGIIAAHSRERLNFSNFFLLQAFTQLVCSIFCSTKRFSFSYEKNSHFDFGKLRKTISFKPGQFDQDKQCNIALSRYQTDDGHQIGLFVYSDITFTSQAEIMARVNILPCLIWRCRINPGPNTSNCTTGQNTKTTARDICSKCTKIIRSNGLKLSCEECSSYTHQVRRSLSHRVL